MTDEPVSDISTEESAIEQVVEHIQPPQPVLKKNQMLEELKHSILLHRILMGGSSKQLAAYLVKLIDFLEDPDHAHRDAEMGRLAFSMVEGLAVFVQQSIDDRAQRALAQNITFPSRIKQAGDNLLVVIGRTRSAADSIEAKNAVLRAIANALRELSVFTKATYPTITTSTRQEL